MRAELDLPLARTYLDPDTLARADAGLVPRLLADPTTLILPMTERGHIPVTDGRLDLIPAGDFSADTLNGAVAIFLGWSPDGPGVVAVAGLDFEGADLRRELAHLEQDDLSMVVPALALANWHRLYRYCPRCGSGTEVTDSGWVRRCRECGSDLFPRTDPAVIMAVTDSEDRLLLAHASHFPAGRYSTIAGYVEPGESLEHAVVRETKEEVGLDVVDVRYRGSQPWPFPRSLMLAFTARVEGSAVPVVDGEEITHARFFSRAEFAEAVASGKLLPPGPASVAHALVEDWYGGRVDEPETFGV